MGAVITGAPGVPGAVAIEKSAGPTGSARRVNRGRLDPVDGTLLSRRFRIGAGLYMRPQLQAAGYVSIAQALPFETRSVQRWNSSDRNKDGVPNRDQFLGRVTRKQFSEGEHLLSTGLDDLAPDDKDIRDSRPQKSN